MNESAKSSGYIVWKKQMAFGMAKNVIRNAMTTNESDKNKIVQTSGQPQVW